MSCSAMLSTASSQVKVKLSLRRGALKHKAPRGALYQGINVFYHARVEILYSGGSLKSGTREGDNVGTIRSGDHAVRKKLQCYSYTGLKLHLSNKRGPKV